MCMWVYYYSHERKKILGKDCKEIHQDPRERLGF